MRWRMVGRVAVAVLVGLVVAGVVGAVGIAGARAAVYTPRGPSAPPVPVDSVAVPVHDPGKPTAAIVLGPEGANDPQPPYDAGHPSKASKPVIDHAKTLLRRQAFNPSELRAIPTIAWQRAHEVPHPQRAGMNGTAKVVGGAVHPHHPAGCGARRGGHGARP